MSASIHNDLDGVPLLGNLPLVVTKAEQGVFELVGRSARQGG